MKTKVFTCKVINSQLQAAEYVGKESSWGLFVNRALLCQGGGGAGDSFPLNVISISALTPDKQMGFLDSLLSL